MWISSLVDQMSPSLQRIGTNVCHASIPSVVLLMSTALDIQLVCKYKLDKQISRQSRAFFDGLSDIIDPKWLRMFDQSELQQLIGGEETPIDIDDLRAHTVVHGFPVDDTLRMFWKVVKDFNQGEKKALLRFVTSCSRPPL
jgi:ubiquitin-protein ligase E3 C